MQKALGGCTLRHSEERLGDNNTNVPPLRKVTQVFSGPFSRSRNAAASSRLATYGGALSQRVGLSAVSAGSRRGRAERPWLARKRREQRSGSCAVQELRCSFHFKRTLGLNGNGISWFPGLSASTAQRAGTIKKANNGYFFVGHTGHGGGGWGRGWGGSHD